MTLRSTLNAARISLQKSSSVAISSGLRVPAVLVAARTRSMASLWNIAAVANSSRSRRFIWRLTISWTAGAQKALSALLRRNEDDADGGEGIQHVAGRTQLAAPGVDAEDHHVVGILVGGEQIGARRVDGEVTRRLAARWGALHRRQCALVGINGEDSDRVGAARGTVDEPAVGMHGDFGAADVRRELGGGHGL